MFEVTWFDDNQTLQKESHSPLKIKHLWIQDGAVITTAACLLALQHGIDLVIMDYHGMPMAQLQGFELHTTPAVQKAQVMVSVGMHAVAFVKNWVAQKLHNQAEFLEKLKSRRIWTKQSLLGKQAQEIWNLRKRILALDGATVKEIADELRGLEGAAGQIYFQTLGDVLPEDYRFEGRSKMPARDPFNSFLNFGYAILYGKTEKALLLAGVNAQIGFLHRDDYNKKSTHGPAGTDQGAVSSEGAHPEGRWRPADVRGNMAARAGRQPPVLCFPGAQGQRRFPPDRKSASETQGLPAPAGRPAAGRLLLCHELQIHPVRPPKSVLVRVFAAAGRQVQLHHVVFFHHFPGFGVHSFAVLHPGPADFTG